MKFLTRSLACGWVDGQEGAVAVLVISDWTHVDTDSGGWMCVCHGIFGFGTVWADWVQSGPIGYSMG